VGTVVTIEVREPCAAERIVSKAYPDPVRGL